MSDAIDTVVNEAKSDEGLKGVPGAYESAPNILDEETMAQVSTYLTTELDAVINGSERKEFFENVALWRRQRIVKPESKTKNTPWPNASNVVTPAIGSNTNGVYSLVKKHIKHRTPLLTVETTQETGKIQAEALQRFIEKLMQSPLHINFKAVFNGIAYDTVSLGTQFVEIPWTTKQWKFKRTAEASGSAEDVNKTVYDGPSLECPRLEDVITRAQWSDIQTAPWIAIRRRMFEYEIQQLAAIGFFDPKSTMEQLKGAEMTEEEKNLASERKTLGLTPSLSTTEAKEYEIFRTYVFWDTDKNGSSEDIIVWFEKNSGAILRTEYNELGRRPIVRFPYFALPKELYAQGVGAMGQTMQDEIDTLHNIGVNSSHLASCQMTISREGSGLPKNFTVQPAKNYEISGDPNTDIRAFTYPDVSGSTVQREYIAKNYMDRFTGGGEAALGLGDSNAKTRATASGTMFLANRSDTILSSVIEDIENAVGEVAMFILMQLVANSARTIESLLPLADIADQTTLKDVFSMNVEDIPLLFRFSMKLTEEEKTEEAKRQGILLLTQLYSAFGREVQQMMMMLIDPSMPPELKEFTTRMYVGRVKLMKETLDMFGEGNTASFVPYTKDLEFLLQLNDLMKEQNLTTSRRQMESGGMMGAPQIGPPALGNPQQPPAAPETGFGPAPQVGGMQ